MKKIDVEKSVIFGKKIENLGNSCKIEYLKKSLDYLNKECYFSDFQDFTDYKEDILTSVLVGDDVEYPYESMHYQNFNYFIPKNNVVFIEEPKKLRPFKDLKEFRCATGRGIGNIVTFKRKDQDYEYNLLFNGYSLKRGEVLIYLGQGCYTFEELMNDYLYYNGNYNEWKPFGVEDDES